MSTVSSFMPAILNPPGPGPVAEGRTSDGGRSEIEPARRLGLVNDSFYSQSSHTTRRGPLDGFTFPTAKQRSPEWSQYGNEPLLEVRHRWKDECQAAALIGIGIYDLDLRVHRDDARGHLFGSHHERALHFTLQQGERGRRLHVQANTLEQGIEPSPVEIGHGERVDEHGIPP
jgi:hypothetical protein